MVSWFYEIVNYDSLLMIVVCQQVAVRFHREGGLHPVLRDLCLQTRPSEFLAVIGPSGCGKSTLLRLLAGLLQPSEGSLCHLAEQGDGAGGPLLVRQENSLFPWKTALENATFGLEMQGVARELREHRARQLFERFGLTGAEHIYPRQMSLGMKQRVAVIRAFLSNPALLLLDEPFAALDAQTRLVLQQELLSIWNEAESLAAVFVTHDVDEAIMLSDRILVLGPRPATIIGEWEVNLPRPRPISMALEPDFLELKSQLLEALGVPLGVPRRA